MKLPPLAPARRRPLVPARADARASWHWGFPAAIVSACLALCAAACSDSAGGPVYESVGVEVTAPGADPALQTCVVVPVLNGSRTQARVHLDSGAEVLLQVTNHDAVLSLDASDERRTYTIGNDGALGATDSSPLDADGYLVRVVSCG